MLPFRSCFTLLQNYCVAPQCDTLHTVFQVLASQCLTALCASAGGEEGCTVAEQPEIDVLLNALLSPCFSVRDAALRVSLGSLHFDIC